MDISDGSRFDAVLSCRKPGIALPDALRGRMERLFNAELRDIRLKTDNRITELGALAIASGDRIFLPDALADPGAPGTEILLAHEIAHVLQQREGRIGDLRDAQTMLVADRELEAEADIMALARVLSAGMPGARNLVARPAARPATARIVQCILLHGRDATRKVDWIGGKYSEDQAKTAKGIIEGIRFKGLDTLTVTGLNQEKFGHESTGRKDSNPETSSVSVWWKKSFGSPLKDGHRNVTGQNSIADAIGVCGIGTHAKERKGKPAYHLHWVVSAGLVSRFYLDNNTVTRMPEKKKKQED